MLVKDVVGYKTNGHMFILEEGGMFILLGFILLCFILVYFVSLNIIILLQALTSIVGEHENTFDHVLGIYTEPISNTGRFFLFCFYLFFLYLHHYLVC